jgi:hypothetical protein
MTCDERDPRLLIFGMGEAMRPGSRMQLLVGRTDQVEQGELAFTCEHFVVALHVHKDWGGQPLRSASHSVTRRNNAGIPAGHDEPELSDDGTPQLVPELSAQRDAGR